MLQHPSAFTLITILALITILIVFGMKYFSAGRQLRSRVADENGYRDLAQRAEAAQTTIAGSIAALQADVADMRTRMAVIEKMLREVE